MNEKYFIAFASIILSGSLGGYITWRIYKKKRFIEAADKFRNIVYSEFEGLYPTPTKWPSRKMDIIQILKSKFPKLEIAVIEFQGHLGRSKRKRFNNAWQKYYKDNYFDYVPIISTSNAKGEHEYTTYDNTDVFKDNFKHNVETLLKFVKI